VIFLLIHILTIIEKGAIEGVYFEVKGEKKRCLDNVYITRGVC